MRFLLAFLLGLAVALPTLAGRSLFFTVEAYRLRVSDKQTLIEYYVTVDGTSVRYEHTPGGYVARVALTVTVADSAGGIRAAEKFLLRSPALPDTTTAVRLPFRLHERLAVAPGRHTLAWTGTDQVRGPGGDEVRIELPLTTTGFPARLGPQVADIQLLESAQKIVKPAKPDRFSKGDYALEGRVSDFYPIAVEEILFYTEVYHTDVPAGAGQSVTLRYRVRLLDGASPVTVGERRVQHTAAPVLPILARLPLAAVPSGNCELLVEVLDKAGKPVTASAQPFQRSNPGMPTPRAEDVLGARATATSDDELKGTFVADLDSALLPHYLLSLRPVATVAEAAFVETLAAAGTTRQRRAYLYHFWKKQSATEAAERWAEYRRRIDYVDGKFANKTFRAYETDQGRVYLQYGPPDQIFTERNDPQRATANSDGRPYQIWNYYKLRNVGIAEGANQTNRTFVFFQRNLGDPSPRLIHSNARGETADANWRSIIGQKFSGRSQFDRNSGTGQQ